MTRVAILGARVMGSALSIPLADNGHDVRLVGHPCGPRDHRTVKASGIHPGLDVELPAAVSAYQVDEAPDAFAGAEIVLSGVSPFGVRWVCDQLASLLPDGALVIAIAKGLDAGEDGDLRLLPEVLSESWSPSRRAGPRSRR